MKKPRKVAIYKSKGQKLRRSGIIFDSEFDVKVKTSPAKNAIRRKGDEGMKITVWKLRKKDGQISLNHIEEGWVEGEFPKPIKEEFGNQTAWEKVDPKEMTWVKERARLIEGVVTR